MINVLQGLNEKQKKAVIHRSGALFVSAGPGTGKTKVITHRIAHLIREYRINPNNILAITFTNKATQVMRDRLCNEELIEEQASSQVKVFTFHAFCQSVLREHASKIELNKNFMVCDEEIQREILIECLHELNLNNINTVENRIKWLSQDISYFKSRIHDPSAPTSFFHSLRGARAKNSEYINNCETLLNTYQHKLEKQNLMDFDDLLLKTVELLENVPEVRDALCAEIHYTLVDEYQDVNSAQYRILQLLCSTVKHNLMAVADKNQAIYGWRGTDLQYIEKFITDFNPKIVKLDMHYRCAETILRAAEKILVSSERHETPFPKTNTSSEFERPIYHYRLNDSDKESDIIINLLEKLIGDEGKFSFEDIAILYRRHESANKVTAKLLNENIKFQRVQPSISFQNRIYKGFISYLSFINKYIRENSESTINSTDLELAINFPMKRIDDLTWVWLKWLAQREKVELIELLKNIEEYPQDVGPLTRRNICHFWSKIGRLSTEIKGEKISHIVQKLLDVLESSRCPYLHEEIKIFEEQFDDPHLSTATDVLYIAINRSERIQITAKYGIDEYCAAQIICHTLNRYLKQDIKVQFLPSNTRKPLVEANSVQIVIGDFSEFNSGINKTKAILIGSKGSIGENLIQLETNGVRSITALKLSQRLLGCFEVQNTPDLVFYDLETRGVNIENAEIVEIAAHRVGTRNGKVRKYQNLVRPPHGYLPKSSTSVHKITEEMVKDSPSIEQVLPEFAEFMQDCIVVGHNIIEFDNPILERNLKSFLGIGITDFCYDTLVTARKLYPRKSFSLEALADLFDIKHGPLHRADEDVEVTKKVFVELVKKDYQRCFMRSLTELLPYVGCAILSKNEEPSNTETLTETTAYLNAATRFVQTHLQQSELNFQNSIPLNSLDKEKLKNFINTLEKRNISDFPEDTNWKIHCSKLRNEANEFMKKSNTNEQFIDFLTYQERMKSVDDLKEEPGQLTLMTLHTAKGTEFPVIIIIGMEDNTSGIEDEERRLFYVGMTRAKKRLYFTSILDPSELNRPSLMFSEIPTDYIKRWPEQLYE